MKKSLSRTADYSAADGTRLESALVKEFVRLRAAISSVRRINTINLILTAGLYVPLLVALFW